MYSNYDKLNALRWKLVTTPVSLSQDCLSLDDNEIPNLNQLVQCPKRQSRWGGFFKVPHNFGLFSIWTSSSIFEFFGQKCWTALDWTLDLCFWIMMPFWTDNYYLIINRYISVKQLMTKTFPTIQDVCMRQNILSPQNVVSPCYHYTRSLL